MSTSLTTSPSVDLDPGRLFLRGTEEDRFIPPGTFVRLSVQVNGSDMLEPDYGYVVRCGKDAAQGKFMCLVAFRGSASPAQVEDDEPYICEFASAFLAASQDEEAHA
jgi:hypothetical protein